MASRLYILNYYSARERVRGSTSRGATGRSPGVDEDGNTYQRRVLESGAEHALLKKVPAPDELRDAIASSGGAEIAICGLQYYWYATYEVFR